ncbi:BMC domain-containing protein [Desulfosporosinus youngiae]|uniref:Carbon dioxide concentrating mechanism/carboxysome shell protein n=1 Tax=Desulfosporosinus youngiae DSM 17734 TaxID=768710 RepID=H5Y074_9FIRM|nr:BMC domain-containing protein [Desulfosporosinus youngiae]EHQ92053.1 carbon dioxide concentrating mechanism/carboxysome shell protein [Desulfosporosinus youngiae DSM 17734]
MQALGLIETRGLVPAIECADVMLKTAQVELMGRTLTGAGLVTIAITGDVGAVKAAVEAGVTAAARMGSSLVSQHVIPRPHPALESMVFEKTSVLSDSDPNPNLTDPLGNCDKAAGEAESAEIIKEECTKLEQITLKRLCKEEVDALVQEVGLGKSLNLLRSFSVVKLRNLARDYKELGFAGRAISKANKDLLIQKFKGYYEREIE